MKKSLVNNKGITLVELLAVIVILGIIAAIAVPSINNILENSRIKAEKTNANLLIRAADLYFIENQTAFQNSVGMTTLIAEGYLEGENLANNSFAIVEDKPSYICGMAYTEKNKVEFRRATIEMINNSGKHTKVGKEECWGLPAIP